MLFERHFQVSYVTPDLDRAIEALKTQYGVESFHVASDGTTPGVFVRTPDGEGQVTIKTAVAKVGDLIIEVMQPVGGPVSVYRDFLLPGQLLRLHHLAMRCDDIEAMKAEVERRGHAVVMEGGYKDMRLIYVDTCATLGHYLEYVYLPPKEAR